MRDAAGQPIALKVLDADLAQDERLRRRFLRESRLAASLDHPNVISQLASGEEDGRLFIAMPYVDGSDTSRAASSRRPARVVAR